MGTLSVEATVFIFASHLIGDQVLKKRICSPKSKFFPLTVYFILGSLYPPGKQTGSQENRLPLKKWQKKVTVYLNTLNSHIPVDSFCGSLSLARISYELAGDCGYKSNVIRPRGYKTIFCAQLN